MGGDGILLFSIQGEQQELAAGIAKKLDIPLAPLEVGFFSNKETKIKVGQSVRGKKVYLLQVLDDDPNDCIMQLLITCYALKAACAQHVVCVIPYLPYSKQSKMRNRGAITCKLMATMLCRAGMDHVLTLDLHSKEIQGFFDCPVDNLRGSPFLIQYVTENIPDWREAVIVAKHPGAAARANAFAERLRLGIAVINGEMEKCDADRSDGRQSPPPMHRSRVSSSCIEYQSETMPIIEDGMTLGTSPPVMGSSPSTGHLPHTSFNGQHLNAHDWHQRLRTQKHPGHAGVYSLERNFGLPTKVKQPMELVGDVRNRTCIIVEGIIDDAANLVVAARLLKEYGAKHIYVLGTHGLLSGNSPEDIQNSDIDQLIICNTVPLESKILQCPKIRVVDISHILAEAVRRMHNGESLSYLFRNIPLED